MKTCAIIGGGASGIALLGQLCAQIKEQPVQPRLKIYILEKATLGQGIAYGTTSPVHLLNISASAMSLFPNDPDHFLKWAQTAIPGVLPEHFLPRKFYHQYLKSILEEIQKNTPESITIDVVSDEALSIEKNGNVFTIGLKQGNSLAAQFVVLAMGNFPRTHLPIREGSQLQRSPSYIDNPWIPFDINYSVYQRILFIGTGLTMIDKVLELQANNYQGEIIALSRHGFLPQPVRNHNCSALSNCLAFSWKDNLETTEPSSLFNARLLLHELRLRIKNTPESLDEHLHSLGRYIFDNLNRVSEQELTRAFRHLSRHLNIYLHRVPQTSYQIVDQLRESKQLTVHAGHLISTKQQAKHIDVSFLPKRQNSLKTMSVDLVINCLGPATRLHEIQNPFMRFLYTKGWIQEDHNNLMLKTSSTMQVIDRDQNEISGLFAMGSLKKTLTSATANVPRIASEAYQLSTTILQA